MDEAELPADPLIAEAGDEQTPAARLWELAGEADVAVRRAVARNPSTPRELLSLLAAVLGEDVAHNPVLPLLLLEDPREAKGWLGSAARGRPSSRGLAQLVGSMAARTGLLTAVEIRVLCAIEHRLPSTLPAPRVTAASAPALPDDLLPELSVDPDPRVRQALAGRRVLPDGIIERLSRDDVPVVRLTVAGRASLPAATVERLSADVEERVRAAIAAREDAGEALGERLAADASAAVRGAVASRAGAAPSLIGVLLFDEAREVRIAARRNPSAPADLVSLYDRALASMGGQRAIERGELALLAARGAFGRAAVAAHPEADDEALDRLCDDPSVEVRMTLAEHGRLEARRMARLARDPSPRVRSSLAWNAAAGDALLERLLADAHESVRRHAASSPRLSPAACERVGASRDATLRKVIARNPVAPRPLAERLARDEAPDVAEAARLALARRGGGDGHEG